MTKFLRNVVKSRPFGCKAAIRAQDREGTAGDRPGPEGVVLRPPPSPCAPGPRYHPLRPPAGAYGARFAVSGTSPGSWVVPRYSPSCTHPVYPPWYTHPARTWGLHGSHVTAGTVAGVLGACTYGRFETPVGEPRGMRTQPVLGSPAGYIQLFEVYTAV